MMKQTPILFLSLMWVMALSAPCIARADAVTGTEKQVDALNCRKYKDPDTLETSNYCYQLTTGSYALTATISAQTFIDNGITLGKLDKDTLISVEAGGFEFSGSLADDAKSVLKLKSLKANWVADQHEVCTKTDKETEECLRSKIVKDATVAITGNPAKSLTLKIQGQFDINNEYGRPLFVNACDDNGNGQMDADLAIGVGDFTITKTLSVKCKVNYKTVDKPDDSFDLVNMAITIKAK